MIAESLVAVLFGLVLGSFLLTVAMRLQNGTSLWERSRCDHCFNKIGVIGLIPIIGFMLQKGKCAHCGGQIAPIYPSVEILNAVLVLLIFSKSGLEPASIYLLFIFEIFFLIALIDYQTYLIYPQPIVLGLVIQSVWLLTFGKIGLADSLFGLFIGAGLFHWISYLFFLIRKKEGLGAGDATLLGLIGFVFGWKALLPVIFWASLFGIIGGGLSQVLKHRSIRNEIAFAPWLVLAAFFVWRFSDVLRGYSLRTFNIDLFLL